MSAWLSIIAPLLPLTALPVTADAVRSAPLPDRVVSACTLSPSAGIQASAAQFQNSTAATPAIRLTEPINRFMNTATMQTPAVLASPPAAPAILEAWRANDGLFYVTGHINGQPVRFLVDTGASAITLTAADAARVGASDSNEAPWVAETANGRRTMRRVQLASMAVGAKAATNVPAAVAPDGLNVSLLGANWIAHISSMTIEGDRLLMR
jgi:aspartyl protease family protein